MAVKIGAYVNCFQQKLCERKYSGMRFFHLATVTKTRSQAASLAGDLEPFIPAASRRAYLFVAFDDLAIEVLISRVPGSPTTPA
jgi:hypothetical protein